MTSHRTHRFLLAMLMTGGLAGCTATVDKAGEFAEAGVAYTTLMPKALDESYDLLIAAQSAELANLRSVSTGTGQQSSKTARRFLDTYNQQAEARLLILTSLKEQNALLRTYFKSIARLVDNDAATGISKSTSSILANLQTLSPPLAAATIAGKPIGDLVQPAVQLAVGAFKSQALHQEMTAHGADIERVLALHAAALQALKADTDHYLEAYRQNTAELAIAGPFGGKEPLPKSWSADRAAYLKDDRRAQAIDEASNAADKLHAAWIAFANADMAEVDVDSLTTAIEQLADFLN